MISFSENIERFIKSQKVVLLTIYFTNIFLMICIPFLILSLDFKIVEGNLEKFYHVIIIGILLIAVSLVNYLSLSTPKKIISDIKKGKYKATSAFGSFLVKNVEQEFFSLKREEQNKCAVIIGLTLACLRSWLLNLALIIVVTTAHHLGVINQLIMSLFIITAFALQMFTFPKVSRYFNEL